MLVCWPVEYPASPKFTAITTPDGEHLEVNQEPAVSQLERYRLLMNHYVQHNCSITVSFDEAEIPAMVDWFMEHWDEYVGVSFLKRNNPLATAEELGFKYLPQECVSRERYEAYIARLSPIDIEADKSAELLEVEDCSTGACPIR
jgi:ribonucleoside-triphosphate reductase